jgi:crotonobetainyl-CoA:carnitine CoA-transferase CaiB-like acyl-CoA transferase
MNGQRVLITAGASGIGLTLARRFIARGDQVAICDADAGAVAQMRAEMPEVIAAQADVTDEAQMATFLDGIEAQWGGIDVVCANADTGGWLDGLRVLDLTNVIAGPTVGSTLARFGAEVTHVQPVDPTVDPWNAVVFGLHTQRGKKSVLLNLKSDKGREALERLIARADVITINGTDQQRDALGLSPDKLTALNPRLILVQLDAFSGPNRGPKSDHLGYDDLAQAATGVMLRFGGGMDTPEEHAHFGTIDVLTGYCACVALGAALMRLDRTGKGGVARASLAAAGNLIQAQFLYDFAGRAAFNEPSGRAALGSGPFYRCYEAVDGWFFLAAPDEGAKILSRVSALSDLGAGNISTALAERFKQHPLTYWQALLAQGSTAVMPLGSLLQTRDAALHPESAGPADISNATFRVIRHDRHPMGRWVDLVAPNAVRPQNAAITMPGPMPKYGADTHDVLERAGYSGAEINQMIETRAAATQWCAAYLPE